MAAGCIVILIADGFLPTFAPFTDFLPWEKFSIVIRNMDFMRHSHILIQKINEFVNNREKLRQLYHMMLLARRGILYQHPQSAIVEYSLGSIARRCLNDSAFDKTTVALNKKGKSMPPQEYWRKPVAGDDIVKDGR